MNGRRETDRRSETDKWRIPRDMLMQALIPGTISALALGLANIADALTVGMRIGESALAAIGIVTPLYMIFNVISLSFGIGGGVTHARLTAEGKNNLALVHFRRMIRWVLGISLFLALFGGFFPEIVLRCLSAGEDYPEIWQMCMDYGRPLMAASPMVILNYFLYYFVENDDHLHLAAMAFTVSGVLDLVLNLLLVLGLNLGVRGAVWATIISQTVSVIMLLTHFYSRRGILRVRDILDAEREDPREVRSCMESSVRIGFSSSVSYVFQFAFQLIMNHLLMSAGRRGLISGDLYVAVFDLVMNIGYVIQPVFTAAGDALQPSAATFSVEQDRESLEYVRRMALRFGLVVGIVLSILTAVFAAPVCRIFGMHLPEQLAVAVPAIRIYLLSMPFAGILIILARYFQAVRNPWLAFQDGFLREAVPLIPLTLLLGLVWPEGIWWTFPLAEILAAAIFELLVRRTRRMESRRQYPMWRAVLRNSQQELGSVVEEVEKFCEEQEIPPAKAMQLQLAVEELCAVTMQKAFSGRKNEYIQVTLVVDPGHQYVLHIRDSAPYFNPLDLKMEKARKDMEASIMDSIGVMMVRKKSQRMDYRHYQGFNTLTVVYQ